MKLGKIIAFALVTISSSISSSNSFADQNNGVIYGEDDRKDLFEVTNSQHINLAKSTVALVKKTELTNNGAGFDLKKSVFGDEFGLCKSEPYFDQPSNAFCSGSLVGEDLMMTAGHCITSANACSSTAFVFNYGINRKSELPTKANANDVYFCKEIVVRKQESAGADYAIIKLDRKVSSDHKPILLNRSGQILDGTSIGVIGHPSGLPTKVAFGAKVRDSKPTGFFVANLDTYGGNSGSAVFNESTGLIEGILVRGEQDFVSQNGCKVSNKCESDACRGEDVTKISEVLAFVPEPGAHPTPSPTPVPSPSSRPTPAPTPSQQPAPAPTDIEEGGW